MEYLKANAAALIAALVALLSALFAAIQWGKRNGAREETDHWLDASRAQRERSELEKIKIEKEVEEKIETIREDNRAKFDRNIVTRGDVERLLASDVERRGKN